MVGMDDHDARTSESLQLRCAMCRKEFKHLNHLRRHEVSHTNPSSFRCQFCSRSFARNDALRRHFKTCSKVEGSADLPAIKRGRKSRACGRCQSKRLRCDGAQPCKRCLSADLVCSFSSADVEARTASRVPMTFMLNYTNPVLDLVSDAFVISEAHAELAVNPADDFEMSVGFLHDDDFMADLFSGIFADFDVSQNTGIIQGTLAEMCGTLPSTYASFEAPGSLEFSRLDVASADPECRLTSLKDWLDVLLGEGWTGPDQNILVFIEMEHLMGILFALHSLIFVSRTGLLLPSTHQVLRRATERWKELWDCVQSRDANRRSHVGFAKYGLELWWLARKILDVAQREDDQGAYMTSGPSDSLQELHGFIRQYSEG